MDAFEARSRERADWISEYNKKQQNEAAELKMKQLDEKYENDEFSDGSEQEPEHVQR